MGHVYKKTAALSGIIKKESINHLFLRYHVPRPAMSARTSDAHVDEFLGRRNNLAHGEVAFKDACRHLTIEVLEQEVSCTIRFLESLLSKIDEYIAKKIFLA